MVPPGMSINVPVDVGATCHWYVMPPATVWPERFNVKEVALFPDEEDPPLIVAVPPEGAPEHAATPLPERETFTVVAPPPAIAKVPVNVPVEGALARTKTTVPVNPEPE